jgi:hypothetical protein
MGALVHAESPRLLARRIAGYHHAHAFAVGAPTAPAASTAPRVERSTV